MNEFIEQFLVECRELVEQATADLLALEERPGDRERLDSVFRAFHTLKGSAGIIEFPAMERALHAAEDALAVVRAGNRPVGTRLAGDCLTCLDQVVQWLDRMEASGAPPPDAEAQAGADALLDRFAREDRAAPPVAASARAELDDWLEALLARHPGAAAKAATAIRYAPDADCFFRGEDPLALLAGLPGLLALDIVPAGEWPALDRLDPYACAVRFFALLSSSPEQVTGALDGPGRKLEVRALSTARDTTAAATSLPPAARALLDAQILLLGEGGAEGAAGRLASAGRVAANVLRHSGLAADAARIERVSAESQATTDPRPLAAAIGDCLRGDAATGPVEEDQAGSAAPVPETAVRTLRVDAGRVDALVRLAGEFTIATNALGHAAALARDGTDGKTLAGLLDDQHAQLERLLGDLQRSVFDLRVLPLRHVFRRFPRLVREIAAGLGKSVRLEIDGDETEADKGVVESLSEPVLHLVRNAIDHGIETAADRAAAGKPSAATIRLRASRVGEHVVVEVEDDGRGIDPASVRRAAAARRIASTEELDAMGDQEVVGLIFAPGLSTASTTTALSGRGVGMDVVRSAVERMGGRVGVESRPGQGTTVRLTLPFAVMMTRVMTVEAGGQVFGIPLDAVVETVRVPRDRIMAVGLAHAFVLRDRTVPLINLAQSLGDAGEAEATSGAQANVVVASVGGVLTGLEVERLGKRMDVMLRPVDGLLTGMRGIAGTTLLGDGRVLIVVDVRDLLE